MEPEARYTLVGTTVLLLVALVTAAVVWLVAADQGKDGQLYRIYFANQSLEGLQVRSDVRMKGIRVGAVTHISFSDERRGAVEVVVGVEPRTPVRESTQAVVDRNLITGLATIRLVNVTEDSPLLKEPRPGEVEPVIAEGASQLQQFSETVNHLAQNADSTLARLNATLSEQNQVAITETLEQMRLLTKAANRVTSRLDGTLASIAGAADGVRVSTRTITAETQRLVDRYDTLGAEATTATRELSGSVRKMGEDVTHLSTRADALLANGDVELRLTGQQLRSAAEALRVAARRFDDPRSALFGPTEASLGPGESRR
jgi:phospholipid/cholesterol/gamma-HCH transport system substrate-binding protein